MEDESIRRLFDGFTPPAATSDDDFMARLERNMDAVDVVKRQISSDRRRLRGAALVASFTGFIVGALTVGVLYAIGAFDREHLLNGLFGNGLGQISGADMSWSLTAAVTVLSTIGMYFWRTHRLAARV